MDAIRNILVIVDPTADQHPAVAKAAQLAKALGARLELYMCDTRAAREARLASHISSRPTEPFVVSCKALLEALAAPLRLQGIDVATETDSADPLYAALVAQAKRTTADLIVKDTHHHSIARRTFLTNTDWQLIRTSPVPLLLVKPAPWAARPRILAAVDPGHLNDKPIVLDQSILQHASTLRRSLDGELHAVHSYVPGALLAAATSGMQPMFTVSAEELAEDEARKRTEIRALTADYGVRANNVHLEIGGPVEVLPRIAQTIHADIIVMGAISRSGLRRAFIGSTAEDVLERLPCDALIVKPPAFDEAISF